MGSFFATSGLGISFLWAVSAITLMPSEGRAADELAAEALALPEITVTARKRDESLQEVPISIAAFGAEQLRERGIDNAYDVAQFTPNFNMSRNLGRRLDRPIIRGMFPPGRGRANAGFFVDNVFLPGEFGSIATTSLDNIERVEVLRGPQAALFGRATFAGAVNYITRGISDVWESEINTRVGSDEDYKLSVWASGPIIEDKLKVYIGAGYEGWDGEWRNNLREGEVNTSNDPATSQNFFSGPDVWRFNIPDIAGGEAPCPVGYKRARIGPANNPLFQATDSGCPPQQGDNTKLGGEETKNTTLKFEFTPTDNLEFNFKYEYAETDDDHFAQFYFEPVFDPVGGYQLAPGLNCKPPVLDEANEIYIPSPGYQCGELKVSQSRGAINMPNFGGVATCPPGQKCFERNELGEPVLDANGNFIPLIVSEPAPFIGAETETQRYLAEAIYNFKDWEIVGRATLGKYEEGNVRDLERTYGLGPVTTGLFEGYSKDDAENESFELRISSPTDARIRGMVGWYYYYQEVNGVQRRFNSFSNGYQFGFSRDEEEENYAIFGSIEVDLIDQLSLTLDYRYAEDTLTQTSSPEVQAAGGFASAEETFYSTSPRLILSYQPNNDMNFYASVAKGNKPGGFNGEWFDDNTSSLVIEAAIGLNCDPSRATDPNTAAWIASSCGKAIVKEEESWTWELGAKVDLLDGRLTANTAIFYIDWTNQGINNNQCIPREDITNADGPNATCEVNLGVVNAGESRIYGAELELQYAATENLILGFSYGLTDSKLEEYFDDGLAQFSCNWWEFYNSDIPALLSRPLPDCEAQGAGDANGQVSELVPKHTANLSANYSRSLTGDMDWFVKSYLNYESKKYVSVSNLAEIGDIYIWDASVGVNSDIWQVTAYIKNILDDDTPTVAFDFPLFDNSKIPILPGSEFGFPNLVTAQAGALNPNAFLVTPRRGTSYGLTAQYRFGG
jgi:outer membrane receptor protein involved in Fe transport